MTYLSAFLALQEDQDSIHVYTVDSSYSPHYDLDPNVDLESSIPYPNQLCSWKEGTKAYRSLLLSSTIS
jgi:hypothetical protein